MLILKDLLMQQRVAPFCSYRQGWEINHSFVHPKS